MKSGYENGNECNGNAENNSKEDNNLDQGLSHYGTRTSTSARVFRYWYANLQFLMEWS